MVDEERENADYMEGSGDAVSGFGIGDKNRATNALNGCAVEIENGAVDAVNVLACEVENDPIEIENGAVDGLNGLAVDVGNGGVDAANGVAIEVQNGAIDSSAGFAIELESSAVNAVNGLKVELESWAAGHGNSTGSSCEGLRTYKRRRHTRRGSLETKLPEYGKGSADSVSQCPDKSVEPMNGVQHNSSNEQFRLRRISDDSPQNCWRKTVLEQMCQSLCENEGGLRGCIQHALLSHPQSSCTTAAKGSVHSVDDNQNCSSQTGWIANGTHDASRGCVNVNVVPSGLLAESNHTNTDMCRRAFFDIVMSEKFAELCGLLLENFQGIKVDNFLDISLINSRMKEGAYESSPVLFHSDVQQLWMKLQKVGTEMVALGKSLSDKSRTSHHEQFVTGESDLHAKPEQTEACGVYKLCACRRCGEKSNGRDCLVCDSCEEMYHVSCIEPAVKEIPSKSWYCAKCTTNGIESPHGDCVVCEKLNASRNPNNEVEENINGLSKHGVPLVKGGKTFNRCKLCGSEVSNGDRFMVCGHPFCPHKYYHAKCLTSKQLATYGPCWYCPSCLCRGCLTDCDDKKIVLCDGCDHAYHLYCADPPLSSIPKGKWFCRKCDLGLQRIHKVKRAYENLQNKLKKQGKDGRGTFENLEKERIESEELIDNSGGVDMLLTAAKTLNFEEKMAGIEMKR